LRQLACLHPESVDELNDGQKKNLQKRIRSLDKAYAAIQVYTEYDESELETDYQITHE